MSEQSRSDEQRAAEEVIRDEVSRRLGVALVPKQLQLPGGARVDVDGVSPDEKVVVEIFAHQGGLRGGQFHKVARDALKLITLVRARPGTRTILGLASDAAAKAVSGRSWLAEALRTFDVEVLVVELPPDVRSGLVAAQHRQRMVNPTAEDEVSGDMT